MYFFAIAKMYFSSYYSLLNYRKCVRWIIVTSTFSISVMFWANIKCGQMAWTTNDLKIWLFFYHESRISFCCLVITLALSLKKATQFFHLTFILGNSLLISLNVTVLVLSLDLRSDYIVKITFLDKSYKEIIYE